MHKSCISACVMSLILFLRSGFLRSHRCGHGKLLIVSSWPSLQERLAGSTSSGAGSMRSTLGCLASLARPGEAEAHKKRRTIRSLLTTPRWPYGLETGLLWAEFLPGIMRPVGAVDTSAGFLKLCFAVVLAAALALSRKLREESRSHEAACIWLLVRSPSGSAEAIHMCSASAMLLRKQFVMRSRSAWKRLTTPAR